MTNWDELFALAEGASNRPWRTNTADKIGQDWLIASFGYDNETDADIILTTDCIRGSEFDGDGALADAAFIAALVNTLPDINRLREALEWYSEKVENCAKLPGIQEGDAARSALSHDRGRRARAALNPVDQDGEA